jgi:hypothetical protein
MSEEPLRDASRAIRLADPLPCVSCGENAEAAYAEPEEAGRWLIALISRELHGSVGQAV